MALYTEKIGLYEKLRALFLFLSFFCRSMKAYGSTDKHLGASQLKIYWLSSVLHILLAIIKWHLFYVFFKNHSLVYLHTIWKLALGHTFLAKSYVGGDSDGTAFSKGTPELCSKEWEWVLELSGKWPNPGEDRCSLESSWGICRPRQVGKIRLFPLNSK